MDVWWRKVLKTGKKLPSVSTKFALHRPGGCRIQIWAARAVIGYYSVLSSGIHYLFDPAVAVNWKIVVLFHSVQDCNIIILPSRKTRELQNTEEGKATKKSRYNLESLEQKSVRNLYKNWLDVKLNTKNQFI